MPPLVTGLVTKEEEDLVGAVTGEKMDDELAELVEVDE